MTMTCPNPGHGACSSLWSKKDQTSTCRPKKMLFSYCSQQESRKKVNPAWIRFRWHGSKGINLKSRQAIEE